MPPARVDRATPRPARSVDARARPPRRPCSGSVTAASVAEIRTGCAARLPSGRPAGGRRRRVRRRVERAVRAFQQQRGLTRRRRRRPARPAGRSTRPRWRLGDRVLVHLSRQPARRGRRGRAAAPAARPRVQGRPGRRPLRRRHRAGGPRVPAQRRHPAGRHLRPGHAQGAGPARPDRRGRQPQRDAGRGADPPRGSAARPARSSSSTPPRSRSTTPRCAAARRRGHRRPRPPGRGPAASPPGCRPSSPAPGRSRRSDEVRARRVRQPHRRPPVHLAPGRRLDEPGRRRRRRPTTTASRPTASRSSVGERFAGLVQREIVARTDLTDLRSHARSWDLLRLHPDAGGARRRRLRHQPRRRRPARRPGLPRRGRRGDRGRRAAALPRPGGRPAHRRAPARRDPRACVTLAAERPGSARHWADPRAARGRPPGCRAGRTTPSSRSSAASTSSRQVSTDLQVQPHPRVPRVRPVGLEPDPLAGTPPAAGTAVGRASRRARAERLHRPDAAALDQVLDHRPASAPGPARRRRTRRRPARSRAARRPRSPARSGTTRRPGSTPAARRARSRPARRRRTHPAARPPLEQHRGDPGLLLRSAGLAGAPTRGAAHGVELPEQAGAARVGQVGQGVQGQPGDPTATRTSCADRRRSGMGYSMRSRRATEEPHVRRRQPPRTRPAGARGAAPGSTTTSTGTPPAPRG